MEWQSDDLYDLDVLKIKRQRLRELYATARDPEQKRSLAEEIQKTAAEIAALEAKRRGGPGVG